MRLHTLLMVHETACIANGAQGCVQIMYNHLNFAGNLTLTGVC